MILYAVEGQEVFLEDFPLYVSWSYKNDYFAGLLNGSTTVERLLRKKWRG